VSDEREIFEFFGVPVERGPKLPDPKDVDTLSEKLSEAHLKEFLRLTEEATRIEKERKSLRTQILEMIRREPGRYLEGSCMLVVSPRKGRTQFDWEEWIRDTCGEVALEEIHRDGEAVKAGKIRAKYWQKAEDSVEISVVEESQKKP